jgi:hypothetical protein
VHHSAPTSEKKIDEMAKGQLIDITSTGSFGYALRPESDA